MKFRTELNFEKSLTNISYQSNIMALGSCFVENIGERLQSLKYNIDINPFGIQYNPASVSNGLNRLLKANDYLSSELFEHGGLWHSYDHHGSFSAINKEITISQINSRFKSAVQMLRKTDVLFITLGTSWIYMLKETSKTVSNCHKVPQKNFERKRLSTDEVCQLLEEPFRKLTEINPDIKIIMTVSPVRHLKDGFHENQLSKATLLLAVDQLKNCFKNVEYFPAYELVLDDLRDYRFYASDMTHPNQMAIQYIWEKFEETFLLPSEMDIRKEVEKIVQASTHKILNPNTESASQFAKSQIQKIQNLEQRIADLDFSSERRHFESILKIQ